MPTVSESTLRDMLVGIYSAKGASAQEAETVARHQVGANLVGHDSHGIMRTRGYVDLIDKGHIVPGAPYEVERSSATSAVINGNWGFGFVVTERAMTETIEKAKEAGIAMAAVRYQGHVGRLGAYAAMAAEQGMIAMIMADSGLGPKCVTPFGGRASRLGTNPICFAAPAGSHGPVVLDMRPRRSQPAKSMLRVTAACPSRRAGSSTRTARRPRIRSTTTTVAPSCPSVETRGTRVTDCHSWWRCSVGCSPVSVSA